MSVVYRYDLNREVLVGRAMLGVYLAALDRKGISYHVREW